MKNPDIVPDKIRSRLDYRALAGIVLLVVSFHILINYFIGADAADSVASVFSFFNPLVVSSVGFIIAVRYRKSLIFGKSYMALAIGYLSIFLGEVTYMLYDIIYNIEPTFFSSGTISIWQVGQKIPTDLRVCFEPNRCILILIIHS